MIESIIFIYILWFALMIANLNGTNQSPGDEEIVPDSYICTESKAFDYLLYSTFTLNEWRKVLTDIDKDERIEAKYLGDEAFIDLLFTKYYIKLERI